MSNLPAAEIVNGWACERLPDGKWDCRRAGSQETPTTAITPAIAPAPAARPATDAADREPPSPPGRPVAKSVAATSTRTQPLQQAQTRPVAASATLESPASRGDYALCESQPRPPRIPTDPATRRRTPIDVDAENATVAQEGVSTFTGNVNLKRADQRLRADRVDYDRDNETVTATGAVVLRDNELEIKSGEAKLDLVRDTGEINDANYRLYDRHARGEAEQIHRDNVANITTLSKTTYTTCDPGSNDWYLRAKNIELDHDEGVGTARHVSVSFMGIPFFYSPWMTFPIDDRRKSGFLTPSFGSSDESGTEINVPYYWNIAPNRDATLAPRLLSKRGLQLNGEYRYLQARSSGQVNLEYLPGDNEYDDEDRVLFAYKHHNRFAERWTTDVNFNYASDRDYFEDLGTDISLSSITHLERRLDLRYQGNNFNMLGRLHDYQTIDRAATDQYARLPQILFNARFPDKAYGLDYGVRGELVHFDRDDSVTGTRVDIEPEVRWPLANSWAYVTPKLGYRYTRYSLNDTQAGADDSPDRGLPIASIDSGLFFEREFSFANTDLIQTLEPRAYYLYIPKRDQDNLIVNSDGNDVVFDTGEYDFSFAQLFRENRFTGADRVNDANQLTLALTTRVIDPDTGTEHLKASIGQILYFDDREVTLPGQAVIDDNSSDFVAEINARLTNSWSGRAGVQWDTGDSKADRSVLSVRYQPDDKRIINLAYRQRRPDLEQADLSFSWPLGRQVNMVGRWNYSLEQQRTLDGFAGIEYESCCWIVRLVGREYVNSIDPLDTHENNVIMLQLELKGLTSFGDRVKSFLGRGILGYGRDPQDEF
ncbi:MAG: LPS assembly protein LptD [Granulosicoccaceae bacterium]